MTEGTPAMPPYFHLFDSVALAEHRWPNHVRDQRVLGVRTQCPVRPDKTLTDGEGPHAKAWLCVRGDTVRLLTPGLRWYANPAYAGRGMGGMGLYGTSLPAR